ncbi:dipeptide/oligopeptide/nickel ABC transporter permease/ATP-binding protein [Marmoricola sp. RAF53]|uniref:dipeptide/oligopeptide/nickel ABC transporter permease/ATP-binding protein n=1 Tax=Marmoricola sp. RAF53 TaxID=3233059 RepID=UPI003F9508B4
MSTRPVRDPLHRRLLRNPLGVAAAAFLLLVVLAAALAPLLAAHDPNQASLSEVLRPPGHGHLLGTDGSGRDVWARLLHGARFSLGGALLATLVGALLGISLGLLAGYFGRWLETVGSGLSSLLMTLPGIVVLLAARSVLGSSLWVAMSILGVLVFPAFYRLVLTAVEGVKHELYVDAARVSGVTDTRIVLRHILTVVRAPVIIQAAIVMGIAVAVQAGLDFLGFGDRNVPTWGAILNDAFTNIYTRPALLVWPVLAIGLTAIALALLANALRDELERSGGPAATSGDLPVEEAPAVVHGDRGGDVGDPLLRIDRLCVGYEQADGTAKRVVRDVSLVVRRGQVHGLIGESGSGKTQTAWSVLRLLPPGGRILSGEIRFDGVDLRTASSTAMTSLRGRRIGYVPQEPMSNLDPAFTVGSQLVEPMRAALGLGKDEARRRALDWLDRVGIPDPERTFGSYPHELSGGMAQRVLIAGAVSCEPALVIADEPTTALDVTVQAEILDLLRMLQTELGLAILIVTHNLGVVADLCDHVSVMRAGRIVETGPVRSVFGAARHPYTVALLEAMLDDAAPREALA